jgi:hypothetical protein
VEVRSYAAPSTDLDGIERLRGLALVKCNGPQRSHNHARSGGQIFSTAEMRHNFAIWPLDKAAPRQHLLLYYCVRCKWAFRVDGRRGSVTPVDQNGQPIEGAEAAARLATFCLGPCSVFRRLAGGPRGNQKVAPTVTFSARVGALILAIRKAWKLSVWRQRPQSPSFAKNQDQRSKRR